MRTRMFVLAASFVGVVSAGASRADDPALASALEKVSKDQIAAFNREDANGTMALAHTKSPSYETAKAELAKIFAGTDAKAEQVDFDYMGHDDEFAVARVKVKVTADEPGFQDNVVDSITLFHSENGAWKVWDSYALGSELVR